MSSPLPKTGTPKIAVSLPSSATTTAKSETPASALASFGPSPLSIRRVRGPSLGEATAEMAKDALPSSFPLHDLGQIQTVGRAGAGFRLDGGSLRLMWLGARRIEEPKEGQGFELSFFAHGKTINTIEARLKEKQASSSMLLYSSRGLEEDAEPGKARLVSSAESWGPTSASSLRLEQAGKFSVELVTSSPEALKGAVRIRVFGDDATATKNLQQVINQLGLQKLFAPPKPSDLERFKLFRFLWHFAPEHLDQLKMQSPLALDDKSFELALAEAGVSDSDPLAQKMDAIPLHDAALDEYLRLLRLFADQRPKDFVEWTTPRISSTRGILPPEANPPTQSVTSLRGAMSAKGIDVTEPGFKEKLAQKLTPEERRRLLDFGILLAKDAAAATQLLLTEVDHIGVERLRELVKVAGFDLESPRIQNLRFEEVYPGYFTVLDPGLPDRLAELGARYLYSTADTPERVLSMLSEGQKSSATRFAEGLLVQGKSSNADFNSGGAFSVFTRLVTESAIDKGLSFGDWSGSRPYKIVISRDALGRLDWYGYNSDNFGKSTGLTAAHHGERLINTIQANYGGGNEIMFPVGNDPAFFDFVVCSSEADRKKLTEFFAKNGLTQLNGRAIQDFVRVESSFFEHPRDQTLERAVGSAVKKLNLVELDQALEAKLRSLAESKVEAWAKASAVVAMAKEAPATIVSLAEKAARSSANAAAKKAALSSERKQALKTLEPTVIAASEAAAQKVLTSRSAAEFEKLPTGPIDKVVRSAGKNAAEQLASSQMTKLVKQALAAQASSVPAGLDPEERAAWLKTAIGSMPFESAVLAVKAAIITKTRDSAMETALASIKHRLTKGLVKEVREAAEASALVAAKSGAESGGLLTTLEPEIADLLRGPATLAAQKALGAPLEQALTKTLLDAAKQGLGENLAESGKSLVAAHGQKVITFAEASALEAAKQFVGARGRVLSELEKAEALTVLSTRLDTRIEQDSKRLIGRVVKAIPKGSFDPAVKSALAESLPGLIGDAAKHAAATVVDGAAHQAAERLLENHFAKLAGTAVETATQAALEKAGAELAPPFVDAVLETTARSMAEHYVGLAKKAAIKAELGAT